MFSMLSSLDIILASSRRENLSSGFPIWSDTNQIVQTQKMVKCLKFRILEVDGLYQLRSETKGAVLMCGYRAAVCDFVCTHAEIRFSREVVLLRLTSFDKKNTKCSFGFILIVHVVLKKVIVHLFLCLNYL